MGRLFAVLGLACWALMGAPSVLAHATYVRSEPMPGSQLAAPARIVVVFTEDVDVGFSELQVLDSARRRVDRRDTQLAPNERKSLTVSVPQLPDGTYTVAWKTLSAVDGHSVQGVFPLVVGEGSASTETETVEVRPDPLAAILRGVSLLGSVALFGGFGFVTIVLIPSVWMLRRNLRGFDAIEAQWERRLRRSALLVVGALVAATALSIVVQTASAADVPLYAVFNDTLVRYLGTRNGVVWIAKLLLLVAMAGCLLRLSTRTLLLIGLPLSGAWLLATSVTSHAAALPRGAELAILIDWLHQVGASLWLGSLIAALVLLPGVMRAASAERTAMLSVIVPRLSALALGSVLLLVSTGALNAYFNVSRPEAFASIYGGLVLFKIGALIPMLFLGAANLLIFKPRLAQSAIRRLRSTGEAGLRLVQLFRLSVIGEVALGVAILFATGFLTSAEPARDVWSRQPQPIDLSGSAEDLRARVQIAPGRIGSNAFRVDIRDGADQLPPDIQRVQLRFRFLDQELGQGMRIVDGREGDTYVLDSSDFSVPGRWLLEVVVRRLNREDTAIPIRLQIGLPAAELGGAALPLPSFSGPYAPIALALFLVGFVTVVGSWSSPYLRRAQRPTAAFGALIVVLVSGVAIARSASFTPDPLTLRNPIPATNESVARGRELYFANDCPQCHGDTGRGDGPFAIALRPPPADFRVHMAAGHIDGQLFDWISSGVRGTGMPPFRDRLSEDERWDLINFIRGFATGDTQATSGSPTGGG